jgi:hypothetical protein
LVAFNPINERRMNGWAANEAAKLGFFQQKMKKMF